MFVEYGSLQKQLRNDTELSAAVDARFHAYAKAWWSDYTCIRPMHQTRLIQIFGLSEERRQRCVCTFVAPLRADRCLDSPLHAARFVRLIPYAKHTRIGGQRTEIWHSAHTILARRCGDLEDHAALLCSLFLGFGLDAYVAVGTTHDKGAHVWVVTRGGGGGGGEGSGGVVFWESLTGQRFELDQSAAQRALHAAGLGSNGAPAASGSSSSSPASSSFPFHRIHCLFNHRQFFANAQLEDEVHMVDWRLEHPAAWKAMNERAIDVLPRRAQIFLRAPVLQPMIEEKNLERKMRELVANYRREYANVRLTLRQGLLPVKRRAWRAGGRAGGTEICCDRVFPFFSSSLLTALLCSLCAALSFFPALSLLPPQLSTSWSSDFSYVLGPALASYESERVTGACFGNAEFQQAIKRTVPFNCVFKGVPFQVRVTLQFQ